MSKEKMCCGTACRVAVDYERKARISDVTGIRSTKESMSFMAGSKGVTVKEVKEHWRCVDMILGKDPNEFIPNHILQNHPRNPY